MGSEWEEVSLNQVCTIRRGSSPRPIVDFISKTSGFPWVKIADATQNDSRIINKTNQFIKQEGICKSVIVEKGDLILSNSGTAGLPKFMGITACIHDGWQVLRDLKGITKEYLYYVLIHIRSALLHNAYDSTMKNLTLDMVREARIRLPPLSEQKAIAHILGSLDEKIELNRQMNETLESMAQALFKSWFVEFDPVIDNALAAGNATHDVFAKSVEKRKAQFIARGATNEPENNYQSLFPSEFEFTEEMGWIPKGWPVGNVSDIAENIKVNAKSDEITDSELYVGLENIGRKQLFLGDAGTGSAVTSNKSRFQKFDILFGKLRPYFHKVCIAPSSGICSTDILVFRPKKENLFSYLSSVLFSENLVDYSNMRATGTRMARANAKDILAFSILSPPEELVCVFESTVSKKWSKGLLACEQGKSLEKLRDTLLPKLLSGEVRIPDAKKPKSR